LKKLHGGIQQTQEYLAQEVIAQQSPLMQDWLVKSAILNRFCEPLVQTVCAAETRAGAAATDRGKFIEAVVAGNLFVIPLDTGGEWFRYHHQFQQLLQHELNKRMAPDEIAGLHLRASEWFESQGLIGEAIQYAMKAKDGVRAAEIIERHHQVELNKELWHVVAQWLAMLPLEVMQQRPKLLLAHAWGLFHHYKMQEIPLLLERVESLPVDESADETLLGEINFFRGFILTLIQGDADGALIQFDAARKRLSRSEYSFRELEVLDSIAHQMAGKGAFAIQLLDQKIHAIGSGKDPIISRLLAAQVFNHLLSGNLMAAARAAQRFTTACKKTGEIVNAEAWSRYLQANAELQSYHLDEALQGFLFAAEKRDILNWKAATETQVGLVLTYQALQRSDNAVDAMKHLMAFALDTGEPEHIVVAQSCQARLSLLQGDSKAAIDWARSFGVEAHAPSMLMWLEIPVITHLRIMVATGSRESLQQAGEMLARLRQSAEALRNIYQSIDLLVLQSLALEKLGRTDEALEVLQQAVKLAQAGGWIRPFVELGRPMAELLERLADQKGVSDYVHLVLDKFPTHDEQPAGTAAGESRTSADSGVWLAEPLTKREFDVLQLLAQRLQTKEIAAKLFVSPETVKAHLKHLYQKLDVKNRREAAIKAAEILSRRRDTS
jgi:LuxR family maltose regulon positive regulatory protein